MKMARIGRVGAGMMLALGLVGCSSIAVNVDRDTSFDFSGLRTFAWLHENPLDTGDPRLDSELLDQRVRRAVESELVSRGFKEATPDKCDFLLNYNVMLSTRLETDRISGSRYGYGGGWSETLIYEYQQGSLILDVLQGGTKRHVWRGTAEAEVKAQSTPEQRDKRIREAVKRLLDKFPIQKPAPSPAPAAPEASAAS